MLLMKYEMCLIDNWKNWPNSIHPGHLIRYLSQDKAKSAKGKSESESILNVAFLAVVEKGEIIQIVGDLFELIHIDNIIKITKINQK